MFNTIRIRNRLLQMFYRPRYSCALLDFKTLAALDEIDKGIENRITPLLSDFF